MTRALPTIGARVRFAATVSPTYAGLVGEVVAHETFDTGTIGVAVWWQDVTPAVRARLGMVFPPEVLEEVRG